MTKVSKKDVGATVHKNGVTFRVWAPFAGSVAVIGSFNNWSEMPMNAEGDGYWTVDIPGACAGQEYKYVIINGEQKLFKNDPRALELTTNAGNSVIVDTHFDWTDNDFKAPPISQQALYELHVGTFHRIDPATPGTFQEVKEKLDYLVDLGINMIELMPISSMAYDRGWGYTPDYIYAIESLYGGRGAFLELVNAAHSKGIGVIVDMVYNHFGPEGMDLWQFDGWGQDGKGGIYFYNDWRSSTPWGETRPDYGRAEVRQYIIDNVKMWLHHSHVDGLRIDSTAYIRNVYGHNDDPNNDLPDGWSILQHTTSVARKINLGAVLIAEDIGWNQYITKPESDGGAGFSAQWEINLPRIIRSVLGTVDDRDRHFADLCAVLDHRYNGDAWQRVVYSDSHDSAANGGTRLDEVIAPGAATGLYARKRSLLAAALILTMPGIPMLLQGQEFMQSGGFNDWQALDWENVERYPGILEAHKHLIALRKNQHNNTAGLMGQSLNILHQNEDGKVLGYHRWDKGGSGDDTVVVINFANTKYEEYIMDFPRDGKWQSRFNSSWKGYSPDFTEVDISQVDVSSSKGALRLAPYSVVILSQDQ